MKKTYVIYGAVVIVVVALVGLSMKRPLPGVGPVHRQIKATVFWVGEPAGAENGYQQNETSAWDEQWLAHFGGIDHPDNRQRQGERPAGFEPLENPYYFALPYGEFTAAGEVKQNVNRVFWYNPKQPPQSGKVSILKNRWIRVTFGNKTVYAQWEDVGPYETDDPDYVFGTAPPREKRAGLDLSPAAASYLGMSGRADVSWQFVNEADVPQGPWREIITSSQVNYARQ